METISTMRFNATEFWNKDIDNSMTSEKWERKAKLLWELLDDIDTASDMFKPEKSPFYHYVMRKAEKRFDIMASDGYSIFPLK